jgi:hypothetical protein
MLVDFLFETIIIQKGKCARFKITRVKHDQDPNLRIVIDED